jgi:hypothetical protein
VRTDYLIAVGLLIALVLLLSSRSPAEHPRVSPDEATRPDFVFTLPSESLASVAASADGKYLVLARNSVPEGSSANMTELTLFDLGSGKVLWSAVYANPNCCGLPLAKMTADAQLIVGAGKQLHLYTKDGQELKVLRYQEDTEFTLLSAEVSSAGNLIAATTSHRAYLFSREGQRLWSAQFEDVPVVALSGDGRHLLVATSKLFQLYSTTDFKLLQEGTLPYEGPGVAAALAEDGSAFALAGNPAVGRDELTVYLWKNSEVRRVVLGEVNVPQLAIAGSWLWVEGRFGGEAALISINDGTLRRFTAGPSSAHLAVDPGHDRLALARGAVLELHRLSDDQLLWQTRAPGRVLVLLLHGSKLIALGNENDDAALPDRVWAWDISDRE